MLMHANKDDKIILYYCVVVVEKESLNGIGDKAGGVNYESLVQETRKFLSGKLPQYAVESFIVSGYDTLDCLTSLDEECVEVIEQYITDEFSHDHRFTQGIRASGVFKFPPGHRKTIINLIASLKEEKSTRSLKRCAEQSDGTRSKKRRIMQAKSTDEDSCNDPLKYFGHVRQKVVKWVRSQKDDDDLKQLKEHEHYEVSVVPGQNGRLAIIRCKLCGQDCKLGCKDGKPVISNWSKHVKRCVIKKRKTSTTPSMTAYLIKKVTTGNELGECSEGDSENAALPDDPNFRLCPS